MFSERIKRLTPYVPGEQPQDRSYIKLNTNENPYPPTPKIQGLLGEFGLERLRLYPDPAALRLRRAIGETCGLTKDEVFVSNGSDEALSFCFYAFFESGHGRLLFPEFTYSFFPVYCSFYDIQFERVPLAPDFSVDVEGFLHRGPSSCGLILANPNAPTGIALPLERIRFLLDHYPENKAVIVDEAYIDFGGESAARLIRDHPNLVVVRTFSKSLSLAGLRLGFVLAQKNLIDQLFTVKDAFNSYPCDTLSQTIGEMALSDQPYFQKVTAKIIATRDAFASALGKMGWQVLPSKANFVFAGKEGIPGEDIYAKLKERGILVRWFDTEGIRNFVRITIGTDDDMERFLLEAQEAF